MADEVYSLLSFESALQYPLMTSIEAIMADVTIAEISSPVFGRIPPLLLSGVLLTYTQTLSLSLSISLFLLKSSIAVNYRIGFC